MSEVTRGGGSVRTELCPEDNRPALPKAKIRERSGTIVGKWGHGAGWSQKKGNSLAHMREGVFKGRRSICKGMDGAIEEFRWLRTVIVNL